MNIPKSVKTYCKKCKKHTEHRLKTFKPGAARAMSKGQRKHLKKTKHGYGGKFKFPIKPKKQTKKPTFIAECPVCHSKRYFVIPKKMKKAEIAAKE